MGAGIADETKPPAAPQLSQLLHETARLCEDMYEAQVMCDQVRRRLAALFSVFVERRSANPAHDDSQGSDKALAAKVAAMLIVFHDFLTRFVRKEVVFRLVSKRVVTKTIRAFHVDIDAFLDAASKGERTQDDEVHAWVNRFENACENLHIEFSELSRDRMSLLRDLMDLQSQQEALTLIMYEYKRPAGTYSPAELQVIQNAFNTITRFSRAKAPVVPKWFLPPHDVEFEREVLRQLAAGIEVHRGAYAGTRITVTLVHLDLNQQQKAAFVKALALWLGVSEQHQHVGRLYGASHVGEVFYATESLDNGTLGDLVARDPKACVWAKLYEAAQGLQYLHEQKLAHGDLKTGSIIIDDEGSANIADNIASSLLAHPVEGTEVSWRAPECREGDSLPSFAGDIYSFGVCILDVTTPSQPLVSSADDVKTLLKPDDLTADQWSLVQTMCATQPDERPEMAVVVEELRRFAEVEAIEREQEQAAAAAALIAREEEEKKATPPVEAAKSVEKPETKEEKKARKRREKEEQKLKKKVKRQESEHKGCVVQ